jgi:hypothetical protein
MMLHPDLRSPIVYIEEKATRKYKPVRPAQLSKPDFLHQHLDHRYTYLLLCDLGLEIVDVFSTLTAPHSRKQKGTCKQTYQVT